MASFLPPPPHASMICWPSLPPRAVQTLLASPHLPPCRAVLQEKVQALLQAAEAGSHSHGGGQGQGSGSPAGRAAVNGNRLTTTPASGVLA